MKHAILGIFPHAAGKKIACKENPSKNLRTRVHLAPSDVFKELFDKDDEFSDAQGNCVEVYGIHLCVLRASSRHKKPKGTFNLPSSASPAVPDPCTSGPIGQHSVPAVSAAVDPTSHTADNALDAPTSDTFVSLIEMSAFKSDMFFRISSSKVVMATAGLQGINR